MANSNSGVEREVMLVLLQWGVEGDDDELADIGDRLNRDLYGEGFWAEPCRQPRVRPRRITNPQPGPFLSAVRDLRRHPEAQVVYISAHGNASGLSASQGSPYVAGYRAFAEALCEGLDRRPTDATTHTVEARDSCGNPRTFADCPVPTEEPSPVTLVLGSCHAMSDCVCIEQHMPELVSAVYGFTDKPSPDDVAALLAGVWAEDLKQYEGLHAANQAACSEHGDDPSAALSSFAQLAERVFSDWVDGPDQFVSGGGGRCVVRARRDNGGNWERRQFALIRGIHY